MHPTVFLYVPFRLHYLGMFFIIGQGHIAGIDETIDQVKGVQFKGFDHISYS